MATKFVHLNPNSQNTSPNKKPKTTAQVPPNNGNNETRKLANNVFQYDPNYHHSSVDPSMVTKNLQPFQQQPITPTHFRNVQSTPGMTNPPVQEDLVPLNPMNNGFVLYAPASEVHHRDQNNQEAAPTDGVISSSPSSLPTGTPPNFSPPKPETPIIPSPTTTQPNVAVSPQKVQTPNVQPASSPTNVSPPKSNNGPKPMDDVTALRKQVADLMQQLFKVRTERDKFRANVTSLEEQLSVNSAEIESFKKAVALKEQLIEEKTNAAIAVEKQLHLGTDEKKRIVQEYEMKIGQLNEHVQILQSQQQQQLLQQQQQQLQIQQQEQRPVEVVPEEEYTPLDDSVPEEKRVRIRMLERQLIDVYNELQNVRNGQ